MERLKNKVAIITGAADGIGLAISQAFAKEGASVMMSDINADKCEEEAAALVADGYVAKSVLCDVSNTREVKNLVETTLSAFEKIDVLINNAAVAIGGHIATMPEEDWDELMNTNLKSIYRSIKQVIPHLQQQRSGSIINISSVQAFRSWNNWTAYAGAKGAILSMTNQLAGQFGAYNVRFNTISPGAILTPMSEKRVEAEGEEFLQSSINQAAMRRMGTPQEVAMTAVFLASDESSFITGEDIKVDGGLCSLPRYI